MASWTPKQQSEGIKKAKGDFAKAQAAGDTKGMARAHAEADSYRGYSTNHDGTQKVKTAVGTSGWAKPSGGYTPSGGSGGSGSGGSTKNNVSQSYITRQQQTYNQAMQSMKAKDGAFANPQEVIKKLTADAVAKGYGLDASAVAAAKANPTAGAVGIDPKASGPSNNQTRAVINGQNSAIDGAGGWAPVGLKTQFNPKGQINYLTQDGKTLSQGYYGGNEALGYGAQQGMLYDSNGQVYGNAMNADGSGVDQGYTNVQQRDFAGDAWGAVGGDQYGLQNMGNGMYFDEMSGQQYAFDPYSGTLLNQQGMDIDSARQEAYNQMMVPQQAIGDIGSIMDEMKSAMADIGSMQTESIAAVANAMQQQMSMIDQMQAQIEQRYASQGLETDPQLNAALGLLRQEADAQYKQGLEELNARGVVQSGALPELMTQINSGLMTQEQQMISTRMGDLNNQLNSALMSLADSRMNAMTQYGSNLSQLQATGIQTMGNMTSSMMNNMTSLYNTQQQLGSDYAKMANDRTIAQMNNNTSRYVSDNSLRGTQYSADRSYDADIYGSNVSRENNQLDNQTRLYGYDNDYNIAQMKDTTDRYIAEGGWANNLSVAGMRNSGGGGGIDPNEYNAALVGAARDYAGMVQNGTITSRQALYDMIDRENPNIPQADRQRIKDIASKYGGQVRGFTTDYARIQTTGPAPRTPAQGGGGYLFNNNKKPFTPFSGGGGWAGFTRPF